MLRAPNADVFRRHRSALHTCVQGVKSAAWAVTGDRQGLFRGHRPLCWVRTERSLLVQGRQPTEEGGWGEEEPVEGNDKTGPCLSMGEG